MDNHNNTRHYTTVAARIKRRDILQQKKLNREYSNSGTPNLLQNQATISSTNVTSSTYNRHNNHKNNSIPTNQSIAKKKINSQ